MSARAALLLAFAPLLASPALSVPWKQVERAMVWSIDQDMKQCFATRPMELTVPSQVVVGVTEKDIALTFENMRWRLPVTPTNMATMQFDFADGKPPISAQVLLLSQFDSFQLFPAMLEAGEAEFWQRFRTARVVNIKGDFKPGRVQIDLGDPAPMLEALRKCVATAQPGRQVPF